MSEAKADYIAGNKVNAIDLNKNANNSNDGGGFRDSLLMGEAFTGATTPQPAFINKSDNKLYKCDADDLDLIEFVGFVLNTGSADDDANLQSSGIVRGFTGLAEGEYYYVQDTVGTIGINQGTNKIVVGRAISATELLIIKNLDSSQTIVEASDVLKASANTERLVNGYPFYLAKQFTVAIKGTYRIKFDLKESVLGFNIQGKIYKNGVAYGVDRVSTGTSYVTFSEDLDFEIGDTIELWVQDSNPQDGYVRNFRVYYDKKYPADITVDTD